MDKWKLIEQQQELLNEYKKALGLAGGYFDEERCAEIQKRIDEMKLFSTRVDRILGNKPRMEVISIGGKPQGTFDLRTLNKTLLNINNHGKR